MVWLFRPYEPSSSIRKVLTTQLPTSRANQCIYLVRMLSHRGKGLVWVCRSSSTCRDALRMWLQGTWCWQSGQCSHHSREGLGVGPQISLGPCCKHWSPMNASASHLATLLPLPGLLIQLASTLGRAWCPLHMLLGVTFKCKMLKSGMLCI